MRTHVPTLTDADATKLVELGDSIVVKRVPDWAPDNADIRQMTEAAFPGWTTQQLTDGTRCLAEYAEREYARMNNLPGPLDESNDHGGGWRP
jgi:hypothetical protein